MPLTRKAVALSVGLSAILSAATIAQSQKSGSPETLVVEDATIDWFQKADVAPLREGVIAKMELRIGKEVEVDGVIGILHKEVADLAVEEARIQASGQGAILKAKAQKSLAKAVVARNMVLMQKGKDYVSREDAEKAEAELAAAHASLIEAQDTQQLAAAKLKSAERAAEEHFIRAPFAGQILEEYKHAGESVNGREPIVKLGNLDKVRVWAYVPIEYAYRVAPGTEVAVQVKLSDTPGKHPIEKKQFRGVICSVDASIQPIAETAVKIYADLDNANHELKPGLKARMTLFLKPEGSVSFSPPARDPQATTAATSVGARPVELPPSLPR